MAAPDGPDDRSELVELVDAWQAWDQHPAHRPAAARLVDADRNAAAQLGCSAGQLHRTLIAARAHGHDHHGAVALTLELLDAGETPAW